MCEAGRGRRYEEVTGLHRITEAGLKEICKRDKLYQTPRLNDVLYLHFQGYQCIENLDEYTELKTLWLESNAISEIQNLTKLTKLKCLYLQNNLITKIENLEYNRDLDTLNVSQNHIRKIENIGTEILPVLNTLNITSNYLTDSASLAYLVECKTLSVLDLANNRIDDILIVKIFEQMPNLKVLVLQGNPVVSRLPQYRKTLILACKELTYLDSRPVFPRDRACAEAWKRDGYEGERKENQRWIRVERRKTRESVNCTIRMRNRHLKPEDQVALLHSSDSEEDQKGIADAEKTRKRAEMEYGSVDAMWDEVSGESQASDHSTTSSASAEDNESVGSQEDYIAERISNRRVKSLEGRPKVLYDEAVTGDFESIEKLVKNTEEKEQNNFDISELEQQTEGKRILIEEMDGNTNATLDNQKAESVEPESIDNPFNEALKEPNVQESKGKRVLIEEIDNMYSIKEELKLQPVGGKEHDVSKEEMIATGLKEKPVPSNERSEAIMESYESVAHCETNSAVEPSLLQSDSVSKPALPHSDATSKPPLLQSDSDSELDNSADLEQTCQTLLHVAEGNNDGEEPTPKEVKSKLIDEMYSSFGSEIIDQLSLPLDQLLNESNTQYELSAKVCCEEETPTTARDLYKEFVDEFSLPPKSKEQLEWEQECADASEKCAHDLAEMGSHLEEDLQELRDQAENMCDNVPEKTESSDESDEELNEAALEAKSALLRAQFQERRQRLKEAMEERKELQDKQDAAKAELASLTQRYSLFAKVMDDATDNVPKRVFGAGSDTPSQDWDKEECMRQLPLTSMEDDIKEQRKPSANAEDDDDDILTRPVTQQTSAEAAEEICDRLNRKLAGEEATLRQLLAELENENETFYSFDTEINYERSLSSEDTQLEMDCASLLNDLISDVIYKDITEMGPDSYPLGPFESDDENTYSEEPKVEKLVPPHLENPAGGKSLRECMDTFKEFLANKSNDKARPVSSTRLEKIRAAKALLLSKSLGDFSKDTPESLDAQLAKDEENRKRHAAASAGRCYAKREKYDDTLEVVDNRLMVVKKDTGELEELPPPPELVSDSEEEDDDDAYDTADDETHQSIPRTPWNTPYEPKPRKSAEHLVDEAMKRCLAKQLQEFPDDTKENDSLEEEFFSQQAKQTFGNLDLEFFEKLDLDKVTTANNAEAATKCMLSYNELKACMKSGATELQLTSEENEMLEEMLSTHEDLEARAKSSDPELERENELLNKMMQRMKEDEEQARELQKQEKAALLQRQQEEDSKPIQLSLSAGSTLYQRWNPMSIEQDDGAKGDGILKAKEVAPQAAETVPQVEEVPPADGQIPEGAQRVPQATERYPQRVSMPPVIGFEDIDDDGAPSDVTTDYSSDEELAVVEPPKISTEMLKAYYYEGFEEDMRMVRENEVRARRGLLKIIQEKKQMLQDNELEMEAHQEKLPQVKSETEKQDKPLVETAKDKWAKIASRLNEFLDPEALAQLQSHEYGESDGEEDDEDIMEDVAGLENFDDDSETHLDGAVAGTSEEEKAAITEPKIELETSPKDNSDEFFEQMSRLKIAPEETSGLVDSEKTKPVTEYEIIITDDANIGDAPTEKLLKESDNENNIKASGTQEKVQENTAETAESTTNLTDKKTSTKFVNLDYFSDTEPSESLVDTTTTEATEHSTQATLKTEQIEFQVDVVSDDGDVVKEVTVEAQVTYQ
ncbi:dynein assembly factor 1, axonemal homolog isoform X2 [Drosophila guanche]|uniref:Dynein axonemal assembly factor 1 homolog n=1 Tax=Drosophila guanche TaxID=7266 RepID=A0A3B0KQ53_DROGU|nr:dynein assembly factor 1, axonemal homolog isoform X2 [Drosophila guanche]SPP85988.1 blast:Dynein assembly factor 1%2C axonemal homolog [Drosophila guanche]